MSFLRSPLVKSKASAEKDLLVPKILFLSQDFKRYPPLTSIDIQFGGDVDGGFLIDL